MRKTCSFLFVAILGGTLWAAPEPGRPAEPAMPPAPKKNNGPNRFYWRAFSRMYKEIIESNWSVKKEDNESFVTFEDEFSIQVSDSFRTKTDKLKWINDLISFSKAWTTTKGRPLSQAEVNEMQSILQSLVPTEEY